MKKIFSAILAIMLLAGAAYSQQPLEIPPPPELETPPGTTLVTELNLTDSDILGMIKQAIPAFVQSSQGAKGEMGDFLKNVDLNALVLAIEDVKVVRAMQFRMGPATTPTGVLGFYQSKFSATDGWTRVLYDTSMVKKGAVAVYSRGNQEFVAVGTDPVKKTVFAVRTVGFVNVPVLAAWAGKSMKYFSEMEAKEKAKFAAAKKPVKPAAKAKKPAAKKTKR